MIQISTSTTKTKHESLNNSTIKKLKAIEEEMKPLYEAITEADKVIKQMSANGLSLQQKGPILSARGKLVNEIYAKHRSQVRIAKDSISEFSPKFVRKGKNSIRHIIVPNILKDQGFFQNIYTYEYSLCGLEFLNKIQVKQLNGEVKEILPWHLKVKSYDPRDTKAPLCGNCSSAWNKRSNKHPDELVPENKNKIKIETEYAGTIYIDEEEYVNIYKAADKVGWHDLGVTAH